MQTYSNRNIKWRQGCLCYAKKIKNGKCGKISISKQSHTHTVIIFLRIALYVVDDPNAKLYVTKVLVK